MVVEADVCIERQSQTVAIEGREGELVLQLSFVEIDTRGITIGIKKAQRQTGLPVGLLIACLLTPNLSASASCEIPFCFLSSKILSASFMVCTSFGSFILPFPLVAMPPSWSGTLSTAGCNPVFYNNYHSIVHS